VCCLLPGNITFYSILSYIFSPGNIFSFPDALTYYISILRTSLLIPEHFIHSYFREHLIFCTPYPLTSNISLLGTSFNILHFLSWEHPLFLLSPSYIFPLVNIFFTPNPISYIFLLGPSSLSIPQNSLHFPSREQLHYLSLTISHFPSRELLLSSLLLIPNIIIMYIFSTGDSISTYPSASDIFPPGASSVFILQHLTYIFPPGDIFSSPIPSTS
jgi:hypothetical protein